MSNIERAVAWRERVAQWRESGQSQRAFARDQGYGQRQLNYWAKRLSAVDAVPALLPVSIRRPAQAAPGPMPTIHLCSPGGWTVTLPPAIPATWVAELLCALT